MEETRVYAHCGAPHVSVFAQSVHISTQLTNESVRNALECAYFLIHGPNVQPVEPSRTVAEMAASLRDATLVLFVDAAIDGPRWDRWCSAASPRDEM